MVSKYEFDKQFKNMGVDSDTILSAGNEQEKQTSPPAQQQEENQEIAMLKRKMDYLTNTILKDIGEKFTAFEELIEKRTSAEHFVKYNREIAELKNEIAQIKQLMATATVSFGEKKEEKTSVSSSAAKEEITEEDFTPQTMKIEKFFNFSNK